MRYDSEHKQKTRLKVISEAAAAIRAVGPDRISVAAIMAKAGLTHGGFYAHFESKDELIAHSITHMFDSAYDRFLERTADPDAVTSLINFAEMYISERHRDHPENGCPLPALIGDMSRMPKEARLRFTAGMDRLVDAVAARLAQLPVPGDEQEAMTLMTQMIGTVALSRVVESKAASARILRFSRVAIRKRIEQRAA